MVISNNLSLNFIKASSKYSEHFALNIGDRWFTYSELDRKARTLAFAMLSQFEKSPLRIGIFCYRSEFSYVGVIASLFAGGTFVPLNRFYPANRTRSMIELADLDVIIADHQSASQLKEILAGLKRLPLILLPESKKEEVELKIENTRVLDSVAINSFPPLKEPVIVDSDSPLYLLFSSGSTGTPKGIEVTHNNLQHFLQYNQNRYQITQADRLSQTFDQTFDASIFDLFMAWSNGACVCVIPKNELLSPFKFISEKNITVWFCVPSVVALLMKRKALGAGIFPGLRLSLFIGEALPASIAEAWQMAAPNSVLENIYGPTELTVACSAYRWDPQISPSECENKIVPIGKLYDGLKSTIINEDGTEVSFGKVGELCVAGPQVFPGYLLDAEKTKSAMLLRTEETGSVTKFYRTGDLVHQTESENLIYHGRKDSQIKISGYRIELGETEAALRNLPGVSEAVAVPFSLPGESAPQGIMAFLLGDQIDFDLIKRQLRQNLPHYMIPSRIHHISSFPMNSNGKIDRKALAEYPNQVA